MTPRRTVRDGEGNRYVLLKESGESSLVRDPETGDRRHLPNDELERVAGESPLSTAARAVPETVLAAVTAVHDERALGLLLELDAEGPVAVRTLLSSYDLCESDVHGMLAELRAAGLVTEESVAGERGYASTDAASEAVEHLRS